MKRVMNLGTMSGLEEQLELTNGFQDRSCLSHSEQVAVDNALKLLKRERASKDIRPIVVKTLAVLRTILDGKSEKMASLILLRSGLADEITNNILQEK